MAGAVRLKVNPAPRKAPLFRAEIGVRRVVNFLFQNASSFRTRCGVNRYIFILGILIAVYTLFLNTAIYLQYRGFKQVQDFPDYLSTIYLTSRGDIFGHYVGWCQEMEKVTFLGAHISPVILLFAVIYRIVNQPLALFTMQIFCVGLTSVALFYIAQGRLKNKLVSFLLAVSFLLYQPAMSAAVTTFQPEVFSIPLVAFMFLTLLKNRYKWCVFFAILLLCLKENMGFIVSMFGLYVFFKNNKKLGLFLCFFGLLWSIVCIGLLIPYFREGRNAQSLAWFGHLGGSWPEILSSLILHPLVTVKKGLAEYWVMKTSFQWYMLVPLLYLPLLYPEILFIALPVIGQIYLAKHHFMASSLCYYHASIDSLLFIAAIYAIGRLFPRDKKIIVIPAIVILIVNFYISLFRSQFFDIIRNEQGALRVVKNPVYLVSERDNLVWQALDEYKIPKGCSIAVSAPFSEIFSGSNRVSHFTLYRQEVPEYIFLDTLNYKLGIEHNSLIRSYLNEILNDPWYELVFEKHKFYIFKRRPLLGPGEFLKELNNFSWRMYLPGEPKDIKDMAITVEGNNKDMVIYKKEFTGESGPFFKTHIFIDKPGWKADYIYDGRDLYSFDRIWSQVEKRRLPKDIAGADSLTGAGAPVLEVDDIFGAFGTKRKKRWENDLGPVPARIWIDAERRIILKMELDISAIAKKAGAVAGNKLTISYNDYRQISGMWFAFKKEYYINNGQEEVLFMAERIKDIKVNSGLDGSLFDACKELDALGVERVYERNPIDGSLSMQWHKRREE